MNSSKVLVTTHRAGTEVPAGYLYPAHNSGVFSYTPEYLAHPASFALAPSLPLVAGPQAFGGLGGFSDSAPDRWGRKLLQRAHGRTSLGEFAYLFGVNDASRQGATRFWIDGVAVSDGDGVPTELELPELLSTADAVENNLLDLPPLQARRLFRATGSLGGARPKANITIAQELWLAKFPKPHGDEWDIMGWESIIRDVQEKCQIQVPVGKTYKITDLEHNHRRIYLQRRFDRTAAGQRIPYISAMTALEAQDGEGGDWVDLFEFARENGGSAGELWKRLAFGYLIGNTDDHLRNHGFLRKQHRWEVAPSFDVNPTPDGNEHQLCLWGNAAYSLDDVLGPEVLALCALSPTQAREWLAQAAATLAAVPAYAQQRGLDGQSIAIMAGRFDNAVAEIRGVL